MDTIRIEQWLRTSELAHLAAVSRSYRRVAIRALQEIRIDITRGSASFPVRVLGNELPPDNFIYCRRQRCSSPWVDSKVRSDVHVGGLALTFSETNPALGWSLKTLEKIAKGQRVCDYTGELLSRTAAYKRLRQEEQSNTYILSLLETSASDPTFPSWRTTIDARRYGGIARFINHRCSDPNLLLYPLRRHIYQVPTLAFFAVRDINANEELTFDYHSSSLPCCLSASSHSDLDVVDHSKTRCLCGARHCRGWLPRHYDSLLSSPASSYP